MKRDLPACIIACVLLPFVMVVVRADNVKDNFVFVGSDIGDNTDSDIIMYYDKSDHNGEGRTVGFADTHVEFVNAADIPKVVRACNVARLKLELGPIHVPGDGTAVSEPASQP